PRPWLRWCWGLRFGRRANGSRMDDQRTNRVDGGSRKGPFQISLTKLFAVMFWICVFLGCVYIAITWPKRPASNGSDLFAVIVYVLLFASPIFAIGTFLSRE